jgi:homoserine kinase
MAKATTSANVGVGLDVLQVGMNLSSTISNIKDANKRFELNKATQFLSIDEKAKLERELQRTTSLESRIKIVTDAMARIKEAQTNALMLSSKEAKDILKKTRDRNRIIIIFGGSLAILFAILIYKKTK